MGWGLCRFYLLLASQLAILRQQLHQLIVFHERNLDSGRTDARDMRKAERGECLCLCVSVCRQHLALAVGRQALCIAAGGSGRGYDSSTDSPGFPSPYVWKRRQTVEP
jgi:hypothetical protein